jgi:uncharacterized membrane protein
MELPVITLPKVDLPFDIPVLLHPPIDHFAIAIPVVILLLEFYNLFARRKSIGAFSFLLLILTVIVFLGAYLTGSTDGKEAYDLLTPEGQEALKAHKLLGTYLLLGTGVVLFFKLLAMTGKSYFKFFFFVVLLGLIAGTFEQGEHGGELVYKYGANVERVKALDDELFDVKEELEDATAAQAEVKTEAKQEVSAPATIETPEKKPDSANATVETLLDSAKEEMQKASQKALEKATETVEQAVEVPATTIQ